MRIIDATQIPAISDRIECDPAPRKKKRPIKKGSTWVGFLVMVINASTGSPRMDLAASIVEKEQNTQKFLQIYERKVKK